MAKQLKHFGVLGMKWGKRKEHPGTTALKKYADGILNNPKSTKKEIDSALDAIGIDPKTGKQLRVSRAIYDAEGNDISVRPEKRLGKKKGQSDKDFDAEFEAEMARDPDRNTTPANLAKRKIEDAEVDRQVRNQTIGMLATVGTIMIAKAVLMNQIKKRADAAILAKYGPTLYDLLKNQ